MAMKFNVNKFNWHPDIQTYTQEASTLGHQFVHDLGAGVTLVEDDSNFRQFFRYVSTDKDRSGEDIYGWNFLCSNGKKLLLVND